MLLQCRNLRKEFGDHEVLKSVSFDLAIGDRLGLTGKNGAGKTTLVSILAGILEPDEGQILWHKDDVRIGCLRQEAYYTGDTLHNIYMHQDIRARGGSSVNISDFLYITSQLGTEKVHEWEAKRFKNLSGGERTKLALAHIWSMKPDFLILDEPTNHLDLRGVEWLIDELKNYQGTILIISHDRYFLDQTVQGILEIENGVINKYNGNYSDYRNEKKERYRAELHAYESQARYKEKLESEIQRLKNWSAKAHRDSTKKGAKSGNKIGSKEYYRVKAKKLDKQIKSTVKRLEKLRQEGITRPKEEPRISFAFQPVSGHGKRILEARHIRKSFGSRILFDDSSFTVQRGERLGIFGPNGCGKTTLAKAILGEEGIEGDLFLSPSVNIGYISQDISDMDDYKKALELFRIPDRKKQGRVRTMLANLGINEVLLNKSLQDLSMGERTKLKLAKLLMGDYDLLLLDEPTNHLDLYTREQLEEALEEYEGTILLITHDRYMMEKICDKLLVFENGLIRRVEYGLAEYLNKTNEDRSDQEKAGDGPADEEERMVLENRIALVLSKLSDAVPGSEEYQKLDEEFNELISIKNRLL